MKELGGWREKVLGTRGRSGPGKSFGGGGPCLGARAMNNEVIRILERINDNCDNWRRGKGSKRLELSEEALAERCFGVVRRRQKQVRIKGRTSGGAGRRESV